MSDLGASAMIARAHFATGFVVLASGSVLLALRGPWWQVHYEHSTLCAFQPAQCRITGEFAVAWFCLHSPDGSDCEGTSWNEESMHVDKNSPAFALHLAWPAYCLLLSALAMHAPLVILLMTAVWLGTALPNQKLARRCGFRAASFFAFLAGILAAIGLVVFEILAEPYFQALVADMARRQFGRGVPAVKHAEVLYAPIFGIAAVAFDFAACWLAWDQGSTKLQPGVDMGHRLSRAHLTDALEFALVGGGPPSEISSYKSVPTYEPQDPPPPDPYWETPKKAEHTIGRYRQFMAPPQLAPRPLL